MYVMQCMCNVCEFGTINPVVIIEIQGLETGHFTVPINNTFVCHMSFLAADTNMCLNVINTPHDVTVYNVGITVNMIIQNPYM